MNWRRKLPCPAGSQSQGYEPYVIVSRKFVPWADERFWGYNKDKISYLLHLAHQGLRFVVAPRAFVVHSPHPKARSYKRLRSSQLWNDLDALFDQVKDGGANLRPRCTLRLRRPSHRPPSHAGQHLQRRPRCGRQRQRAGAGRRLGMRARAGARGRGRAPSRGQIDEAWYAFELH